MCHSIIAGPPYLGNIIFTGDPPGFVHAVVREEKRLGLVFVNRVIVGIPSGDIFLRVLSVDAHDGEFNPVGIKLSRRERAVEQHCVGIARWASLAGDSTARVG